MRLVLSALLLVLVAGCDRGPLVVQPGGFTQSDLTVTLRADGTAVFVLQSSPRRTQKLLDGRWQQAGPDGATIEIRVTASSAPTSYRKGDLFRFAYDGDRLVFIDRRGRDGMVLEDAASRKGVSWVMTRVE